VAGAGSPFPNAIHIEPPRGQGRCRCDQTLGLSLFEHTTATPGRLSILMPDEQHNPVAEPERWMAMECNMQQARAAQHPACVIGHDGGQRTTPSARPPSAKASRCFT